MSREFPDFIDPWRAAEGKKRISGTIPLARMKRLLPLLEGVTGTAGFEADFSFDRQKRAAVAIGVNASLTLMCQRSLEPFEHPVKQNSTLLVISGPEDQALLSDDEEFVTTTNGRLAILDLVEDELLLAVPQVPRNPGLDVADPVDTPPHAEGESVENEADSPRQRPFEGLADLMKKSNF